jgi:hypothetical protein
MYIFRFIIVIAKIVTSCQNDKYVACFDKMLTVNIRNLDSPDFEWSFSGHFLKTGQIRPVFEWFGSHFVFLPFENQNGHFNS